MELSNHQNISAALCVSFSVFFHPFHGVGHWAERGALHLHAPQTQPVAGDRGLPHSPLFVGSPEVEWVFTLHGAQALTLLLTSFTLSMSLLLYPGSILFPFFYLLEISHSVFLFLSNSASCVASLPVHVVLCPPLPIVVASETFNWFPVSPPVLFVSFTPFSSLVVHSFLSTVIKFNPWPGLKFAFLSCYY